MPRLAPAVVSTFGDDAVRVFATRVRPEDAPRLLGYAERADTPATRQLLLSTYQKDASILERLDWKVIMAGGLSAAAILGTGITADGIHDGIQTAVVRDPRTPERILTMFTNPVRLPILLFGLGFGGLLLWRLWRFLKPRTPVD